VYTPICARCGLAAMSALESLLSDQWKNTLTARTPDGMWITGGSDFSLDRWMIAATAET